MTGETPGQQAGPVIGPVPWTARDVALACIAFFLILAAVFTAIGLADREGAGFDFGDSTVLGLRIDMAVIILQGAALGGLPLYFALVRRGASLRDLGLVWTPRAADYGYALLLWFAALAAVVVYGVAVDALDIDFLRPPETARDVLDETGGLAGALLLAAVFAPITEELFFRGFALPAFGRSLRAWPAVLAASALFAVFHISPGAYFPTFALGVALSLTYLRSGSLLPAMLIHGLHNATAILVVQRTMT